LVHEKAQIKINFDAGVGQSDSTSIFAKIITGNTEIYGVAQYRLMKLTHYFPYCQCFRGPCISVALAI